MRLSKWLVVLPTVVAAASDTNRATGWSVRRFRKPSRLAAGS